MRYELVLAPAAADHYRRLPAYLRAQVRDAIEQHLRHEPTRATRSRVKRLRGMARPQYRFRVGDLRVYYDVAAAAGEVLAIVRKSEAESWLAESGSVE